MNTPGAFNVVIPARYASTRLPGKPLLPIHGRPLLWHVYQCALKSAATAVFIATDDARIAAVARDFGATVCLTRPEHKSGSERIAEVALQYAWADDACVVNLQGDEPCMPPELINQVAADLFAHPAAAMTTLAVPLYERVSLFNPHIVKVVTDAKGYALYFSRAPIPWYRDGFIREAADLSNECTWQRHIGLYAYRAGFLRRFVQWLPTPLECVESLEQLRTLWHGERIHVSTAIKLPEAGVDTPEDLVRVTAFIAAQQAAYSG